MPSEVSKDFDLYVEWEWMRHVEMLGPWCAQVAMR